MLNTTLRWSFILLLVPAIVFVIATPATPQLGDLAIIANQVTQIGQAVTMIGILRASKRDLEEQARDLEQLRDNLGKSIPNAIRQLSVDPPDLLDPAAVPWASDFLNPDTARLINALIGLKDDATNTLTNHWRTTLADADNVDEAAILDLYAPYDPRDAQQAADRFRHTRDSIDRQLAADYAALDAAETLAELTEDAHVALEDLDDPADGDIAQHQLLGQLNETKLAVAAAQLQTYSALRETLDRQQQEHERRLRLTRWLNDREAAKAALADFRTTLGGRADAMNTATLLTSFLGPPPPTP